MKLKMNWCATIQINSYRSYWKGMPHSIHDKS